MNPFNYIICSNQIGGGNNGKLFKIKEINHPYTELIAKIYEQAKTQEYEKERNILSKFSDNNMTINDYLIKIKNINVILEHSENYPLNSNLLIFDYLIHGNLCNYVYALPNLNPIKEKYVKILCLKILKGLKKCHEKYISHNKIDLNNIMFDYDFNPIIIHFSESTINTGNNNYNKDFFALGKLLAELITCGKFKSIVLNKKLNKYYIKTNNPKLPSKKNLIDETTFWKQIEMIYKMKISDEFKKFLNILMKSKNIINIDELFNNKWIKDIDNNIEEIEEIEKDLKKEFKKIYDEIITQKQDNNSFNIKTMINDQNEKHNSLIQKCLEENYKEKNQCNYITKKWSEISDLSNGLKNEMEEENNLNEKVNECYENYENENINNYNDYNELLNFNKNIRSYNDEESEECIYEDKEIQIIPNEPKGIQFNYIEININDENDYNCREALIKFICNLEKGIKEYNFKRFINIKTDCLKNNLGFKVAFEEFEFDNEKENEKDEEEIVNFYEDGNDNDLMLLIIKIELIKLKKKEYDLNSKYYLMFNNIQGDMRDFYEYLKIIKFLATSLLNH